MYSLDDLAEGWWKHRLPGGYIDNQLAGSNYDETAELVEDVVDALVRNQVTFGRILVALVRCAPSEDALAYLGTRIVEDAESAFGSSALKAVERSGLSGSVIRAVLAGYQAPSP